MTYVRVNAKPASGWKSGWSAGKPGGYVPLNSYQPPRAPANTPLSASQTLARRGYVSQQQLAKRTQSMLAQWRGPQVVRAYALSGLARYLPVFGAAMAMYNYMNFLANAKKAIDAANDPRLSPGGFIKARSYSGNTGIVLRPGDGYYWLGRTKAGATAAPQATQNAVVVIAPWGPFWYKLFNPTGCFGPDFKPRVSPQEESYPWKFDFNVAPTTPLGISKYANFMPGIRADQLLNNPSTYKGIYVKPYEVFLPARQTNVSPTRNLSIQFRPRPNGRPAVSIKKNTAPVRPPKHVKEGKSAMHPLLALAFSSVTETADTIQVLYEAAGGKEYRHMSFTDKVNFLFGDYWGVGNVDWEKFAKLFVAMQLEDLFIGKTTRRTSRGYLEAQRRFGDRNRPFGFLTGPLM